MFGIQAAGLYPDAEPRRTVAAMADAYIDEIRAEYPDGPYPLGGCGIGAAIAYEMASRLGDVRLLAAIDAELLEPPDPVTESWSREPPGQSDLPRILASWQERDLVPQDVAPEFVARSLRVWRANRDAVRDWRPPPLHRTARHLRPAAGYGPAGDRRPADTRVRRRWEPGRRVARAAG